MSQEVGRYFFVPRDAFETVVAHDGSPAKRAQLFAALCRINALYMIQRAGSGHIGSSFSSLDLVSWLYLEVLVGEDLYFSSKGHDVPGLYSVLLALGRLPFESIHTLRRAGGLPGHPDVGTPGIVTNTGSLGMGISKAKGFVRADRLNGRERQIYVLTGDGELQEGQIWESLVSAANERMSEITVIVDHNKMQSDTFVADVSDLGDIAAKFRSFGWATARCDGHDFASIDAAIEETGHSDRPRLIVADTIKGRGVGFMDPASGHPDTVFYPFHSGALPQQTYLAALDELQQDAATCAAELGLPGPEYASQPAATRAEVGAPTQNLVGAYSNALVDMGSRNDRVVVLDADLVKDTGTAEFRRRWPERFFECGIAEQDMVSQAGTLAAEGFLPVVHSFASFLSARPNEQIYNNATEGRRIVYVGSLAGVIPGGPGHSHQAVRDVASLAGIPGLLSVAPGTDAEVGDLLEIALQQHDGSIYLRLESVPRSRPPVQMASPCAPGWGTRVTEGADLTLFSVGPTMLFEAWTAVERLDGEGISVRLVNHPWPTAFDPDWLADAVGESTVIVALENHSIHGGLGSHLAAELSSHGLLEGRSFTRIGVEGIPHSGTNDEVLKSHGLAAQPLADRVAEIMRRAAETSTGPKRGVNVLRSS